MSDHIILTEEGKVKLEKELEQIKKVRLPAVIEKIEQAKEMGDLSENAEYHDAEDEQGLMMARASEIEGCLKIAIISEPSTSTDEVGMGSCFIAEDATGNRKEYTVVGFNEADPAVGRISNESPIGQAFMNKKPGETVEFEAPRGTIVFKIIEIK